MSSSVKLIDSVKDQSRWLTKSAKAGVESESRRLDFVHHYILVIAPLCCYQKAKAAGVQSFTLWITNAVLTLSLLVCIRSHAVLTLSLLVCTM